MTVFSVFLHKYYPLFRPALSGTFSRFLVQYFFMLRRYRGVWVLVQSSGLALSELRPTKSGQNLDYNSDSVSVQCLFYFCSCYHA